MNINEIIRTLMKENKVQSSMAASIGKEKGN